MRVLIADDQLTARYILRRELEQDSLLQVCGEAINGADAIAKALETRPDMIILDLAMPVMNGLEAAREINQFLPATPILLYTFAEVPEVRMQAANAGVREVISKADGIKPLLHAIATLRKPKRIPAPILPAELPSRVTSPEAKFSARPSSTRPSTAPGSDVKPS
jgi:DNA-binding NarL/FixJ family response regulator